MKAKLICLLMVLTLCFGSLGAFTACNPAPPTVSVRANAVSVSLLDGKIANFMGAEGFGLTDKSQAQRSSGNSRLVPCCLTAMMVMVR